MASVAVEEEIEPHTHSYTKCDDTHIPIVRQILIAFHVIVSSVVKLRISMSRCEF